MTTPAQHLTSLQAGMPVPYGGDKFTTVDAELAAAFAPGDHLHVVQDTGDLLHVPAAVHQAVATQVGTARAAFEELSRIPTDRIRDFYRRFAANLEDSAEAITAANAADVARARDLGRSTTRLQITPEVIGSMSAGLQAWAAELDLLVVTGDPRFPEADLVERITHDGWQVDVVSAPLGVIGFVFEGRPNVFADAAGVLAAGNTAVLRIGGDALATAQAIVDHALEPALAASGLPTGALGLVPVRDRSAGWALFADSRLSLAVARGSGPAVAQLSAVARGAGVPVSAHGTGGAWIVADSSATAERLAGAVEHSLDRKVCNTINVVVLTADRAAELVPVVLDAADRAAARRSGTARVHVVAGSETHLPQAEFERQVPVVRASGEGMEPRATVLPVEDLGREWEWEDTPEFSLVVVEDLAAACALFNRYSPQFVASLIAEDAAAHEHFRDAVNAPFVGDGFTRWVDGQYAMDRTELGLSNWESGRLLARAGVLSGADLTTRRLFARMDSAGQHR